MTPPPPPWQPRNTRTPATARGLMAIDAARAVVETRLLLPAVGADVGLRAQVGAARYRQSIGNLSAMTPRKQP